MRTIVTYAMQYARRSFFPKLLISFNIQIIDGRKLVTVATTAAEAVLCLLILLLLLLN
jgi:hypothetical protein